MLGRQIATGLILCLTLGAAAQELLWDNNIQPNGSGGTALSPPAFPNIRLAEDFVVPKSGWLITQFHASVVEDAAFIRGDRLELFLYADRDGIPGEKLMGVISQYQYTATGETYYGRAEYRYWMDDLEMALPTGDYWIGLRNPDGAGSGTNYWLASDGGPDGRNSKRFMRSLDGGRTWSGRPNPLRHEQLAFELRGFVGQPAGLVRFDVIRGVRLAGGTFALRKSDDVYLIVEARRPTSVSQPSVQVELEAVTEIHDPAEIRFDFEAAVLVKGPIQWIDLYNFDTVSWERVDEREATTDDSVTTVNIKENAARFIDTDTGVLRTRVSFYDPGIPIAGWSARIDQVRWLISDR